MQDKFFGNYRLSADQEIKYLLIPGVAPPFHLFDVQKEFLPRYPVMLDQSLFRKRSESLSSIDGDFRSR